MFVDEDGFLRSKTSRKCPTSACVSKRYRGKSFSPHHIHLATRPYFWVNRWRPVVIMSFPHFTTKDERYKDYLCVNFFPAIYVRLSLLGSIPKGTILIGNTWGLHDDPSRFAQPDEFRPERYADFPLSAPEYAAQAGENRDHHGYGW